MKDKIIQELSHKKILILGFGREGKSTYNFLKNNNVDCQIAIADMNEIEDKEVLNNEHVELFTGKSYLDYLNNFDLIFKTPGISLKDIDVSDIKKKITSQTEIFLKYAKEKVIGITGTKGKSTTASLIFSMLKTKYNVLLVGNIGLPVFDEIDEYDSVDYYVYELSSHQLEYVDYSPKYAVLLNMFEEHLDHYKSYEEYKEAKRNIYKYQDKGDYYLYSLDMAEILNEGKILTQRLIGVSKNSENAVTVYSESKINSKVTGENISILIPEDLKVKGKHNIYNIAVAVSVALLLGVDKENIIAQIKEFKPLAHRLETVGVYNEVTYIDDSISTIPEAVISAVESIKDIDTVLIGGMDRGINYSKLEEYVLSGKIPNVILMYNSGKRIYDNVYSKNHLNNIVYISTLEEAVKYAVKITEPRKICLLSPAAASYGVFKNFEDRGNKFKEYVIKYAKKK